MVFSVFLRALCASVLGLVSRPMQTESLKLTIRNLAAGYGAVRALHDVSVEVRGGEIVALLGTNGNGKSTLMKCVLGLVVPTQGEIVLELDGAAIDLVGK